jgi:hypothetical protein
MQPTNDPQITPLGALDGAAYDYIQAVMVRDAGGEKPGWWKLVCRLEDWPNHPHYAIVTEARERELAELQARIATLSAELERTRTLLGTEAPRTYACNQCDKAFPSAKGLATHRTRIHRTTEAVTPEPMPEPEVLPFEPTPEPQPETFACEQCGKTFASKKSLQGHMYGKHREPTAPSHPCECGETFATEVGLARHRSSVHGQGFAQTSRFGATAVAAALSVADDDDRDFHCPQCNESAFAESLKRRGMCVRCSKAQDGLVAA